MAVLTILRVRPLTLLTPGPFLKVWGDKRLFNGLLGYVSLVGFYRKVSLESL